MWQRIGRLSLAASALLLIILSGLIVYLSLTEDQNRFQVSDYYSLSSLAEKLTLFSEDEFSGFERETQIFIIHSLAGQFDYLTLGLDPDDPVQNALRERIDQNTAKLHPEAFSYESLRTALSDPRFAETLTELENLLPILDDYLDRNKAETFIRILDLRDFVWLTLSLLFLSLGSAIVCHEILYRERNLDT